jgi:hypothetical protein
VNAGLGRLHRVELVVDGARGASEVVDLIRLDIQRERHIVAEELEALVADQVLYIPPRPREEIVDADDFAARRKQLFAQV